MSLPGNRVDASSLSAASNSAYRYRRQKRKCPYWPALCWRHRCAGRFAGFRQNQQSCAFIDRHHDAVTSLIGTGIRVPCNARRFQRDRSTYASSPALWRRHTCGMTTYSALWRRIISSSESPRLPCRDAVFRPSYAVGLAADRQNSFISSLNSDQPRYYVAPAYGTDTE